MLVLGRLSSLGQQGIPSSLTVYSLFIEERELRGMYAFPKCCLLNEPPESRVLYISIESKAASPRKVFGLIRG